MNPSRARRTQAERTAATRSALLDATFAAIVELGCRGTTTTEVAHRAGVSPGALLHHFPTKTDLLSAAIADVFQRRQEEYRKAMAGLGPAADKLDASMDLLWSMYCGPAFTAWLELWVAARTDPDLAVAITGIDRQFMADSKEQFADMFADDPAVPPIGLHLVLALMDGLALGRLIDGYQPHPTAEVIETFKAMIRLAIDALRPPAAPERPTTPQTGQHLPRQANNSPRQD
jgi:AcrR family transcriptional regulator